MQQENRAACWRLHSTVPQSCRRSPGSRLREFQCAPQPETPDCSQEPGWRKVEAQTLSERRACELIAASFLQKSDLRTDVALPFPDNRILHWEVRNVMLVSAQVGSGGDHILNGQSPPQEGTRMSSHIRNGPALFSIGLQRTSAAGFSISCNTKRCIAPN